MKFVVGGIGDFLQVVDEARQEKKIGVVTHFDGYKEFWEDLGVEAERHQALPEGAELLERKFYPDFFNFKVVGIHPIGSKFSNEYHSDKPQKLLPNEFLETIINPRNRYVLFCSESEAVYYKHLQETCKNVAIITNPMWRNQLWLDVCDYFICVDSAIKTYTAMRRKKTLVLVGDYPDEYRDTQFLNPYDFKIVKFKDFDENLTNQVKEVIKEWD